MISNNMIQNWPINTSDFTNDNTIFGKNLSDTWGNRVLHKPCRLVIYYVYVPRQFLKLYKFLTIVEDVMFVNGTPFLINM